MGAKGQLGQMEPGITGSVTGNVSGHKTLDNS
jgi:hypothetical protein